MEVNQIYTLLNTATNEALGRSVLVNEDLSNVVDVGDEIFNANAVDRYVKALVNHIGRVIFVDRAYRGSAPSVLMDGWEYGSVLEKIQADLPTATENESWELENGASYDPNIFYAPKVSAKFFNKKVTFEIPLSFTELQVKQSFSNVQQLGGFISMLYNAVDKAMTVKIDELVMRTINNLIAETCIAEFGNNPTLGDVTGVKAVNLLKLYNELTGDTSEDVTSLDKALSDPDFIRFAAYTMKVYAKRLSKMSTLFNVGGKERFTPEDRLHTVLLADFQSAAEVYLYNGAGQFKDENLRLPEAETVPYWQGSGTTYGINDVSAINVTTSSGTITGSGILGVMFDRDALGVTNLDRRVTSNYNPKAEFFTNWYKFDAGYFNDLNENFVVFYAAYA